MHKAQANWFAVLTKPRQERIAQEHLCRQHYECFLPLAVNGMVRSGTKLATVPKP